MLFLSLASYRISGMLPSLSAIDMFFLSSACHFRRHWLREDILLSFMKTLDPTGQSSLDTRESIHGKAVWLQPYRDLHLTVEESKDSA